MRIKILSLIGCLFFVTGLKAQKVELTLLPFNTSDIGHYGGATAGISLKNNYVLNLGLTYHYNLAFPNPDRSTDLYFHKRFYAENTLEHFGLILNLQKNLQLFRSPFLQTYVFGESTFRKMGAKSMHRTHVGYVYDSFNQLNLDVVREDVVLISNLFTTELIVGVGVYAKMFGPVYFTTNFGAGTNFIFNVPPDINSSSIIAEYSLKYNIGIKFKL